jgi:hypothetical protein
VNESALPPPDYVEPGPEVPVPGTGLAGPADGIAPECPCPVVVPEGVMGDEGPWP